MPSIADLNKKYAGATTVSAPKPKPGLLDDVKGGFSDFWNGSVMPIVNLPKNIYKATKIAGQGVSVSGNNGADVQKDLATAQGTDISSQNQIIKAIHKETDPAKKQELVNYLKKNFSTDLTPTAGEANPGFDLTNKQVVGSAIQLAALAAGGYSSGAPITQNTLIGAGFSGGQSAMENQSNADIATNTVIGGITGGGATAVMPYAQNLFTGHPIFQRSTSLLPPESPNLSEATQKTQVAQQARTQAGISGVEGANQTLEGVNQAKDVLGTNFEQGGKQIELTQPNSKLTVSNKTLESLNNLKESKKFALPEGLDQETNPLMGSTFSKEFLAKNVGKIDAMQNAGKVELTPTQAQDLIRRLNKLTYEAKASGDLSVNQQTIELTNEIKQAASKTFGPGWDKIYSDYSKGITAVNDLKDLISLNDKGSLDKTLAKVLKLGETPEGKTLLQQAVNDLKNETGIDLTDPVQAMHQILDKQIALEEAQSVQKTAQTEADAIAKKGTGWQQFKRGAANKEYLGKRLIEGVAIGAGSSILIYPALRKLAKILTGQ